MHKLISSLLAVTLTLTVFLSSASAQEISAHITVNGTPLTANEGFLTNDTSYIKLSALCRIETGYSLHWDGKSAILQGETFTLTAQPNAQYITINDRAIFVDGGVTLRDDQTALPTRVIADALAGEAHWDAQSGAITLTLGRPDPVAVSYNADDLLWLSRIISAESRGEPLLGQIAVGNVVLSRVAHWRYPNTIEGVIFDRNYGVQFEPISNGTIYQTPTEQSIIAAKLALEGTDIAGDALYFFAPALSQGTWIRQNCTYLQTIGCHRFYKD